MRLVIAERSKRDGAVPPNALTIKVRIVSKPSSGRIRNPSPPTFYTCLSMSYQSAIDELNAMVPELHSRPGQPRRKFSLDEIGVLLDALDNPHRRFPSVLIAGTNGKGSTAATLASILTASGLRTGLYTSPHLNRPNERIHVGGPLSGAGKATGREISDDDFARLFYHVGEAARKLVQEGTLAQMPSFFETLTAMAFLDFAAAECADGGAGSRHGRAAGRDQHRRSAAFDRDRHLAGPYGMAGLDDRSNRA